MNVPIKMILLAWNVRFLKKIKIIMINSFYIEPNHEQAIYVYIEKRK